MIWVNLHVIVIIVHSFIVKAGNFEWKFIEIHIFWEKHRRHHSHVFLIFQKLISIFRSILFRCCTVALGIPILDHWNCLFGLRSTKCKSHRQKTVLPRPLLAYETAWRVRAVDLDMRLLWFIPRVVLVNLVGRPHNITCVRGSYFRLLSIVKS